MLSRIHIVVILVNRRTTAMSYKLLPPTRYKEIQVTQSKIRKDDLSEIYSTLRRSVYIAAKGHDNSLPGLVLAVIGDSESYVPKPWNTTAFTSGLLQSIQGVKKSWVIYRGNKDGVSALIHNAFRETADTKLATTQQNALNSKIKGNTLIAIRPWTKMDQEGNNKVNEPDLILSIRPVFTDVQKERKYRWFNRYLSHFLKNLSEEYTPLLSKEKEQEGELALINMRVPVLMIAVEGDISTIHQIKSALRRNVPVLLTKGSGKAVDVIVDYLEESRPLEKEKVLKENAPLLLGIYMRSEEYTKLKRRLKIIQKHSHIITIFDLNNNKNYKLEDFVVKAIIKGWSLKEIKNSSANPNDKKKISVVMNNVEIERAAGCLMEHFHVAPGSLSLYFYIAYQYILESCEIENKEKELELFLLEAIIANRVDYVSTLIQHGVTFDRNYMCRLFDETLKCDGCDAKDCRRIHAIHFRVSTKCCDGVWCTCNGNCKECKMHCKYEECKKQNPASSRTKKCQKCSRHKDDKNKTISQALHDLRQNVRKICQKLLHYPKEAAYIPVGQAPMRKSVQEQNSKSFSEKMTDEKTVLYHVLLAWAIFAQKEDLALIFWSKCENPLLAAIMASSILNTMAEMVNSAKDLKLNNDLLKHSRLFEKRALFLMDSLYEENEIGCMSLVNTEDKVWGIRVAPVECAFDNGMIDVVGHPCVQRLLNRIWYKDTAAMWRDWMKNVVRLSGAAWTSPAMMFMVHYLLMFGILIAYSAFLLSNVNDSGIGFYEMLLYFWIIADAVEEIVRNIVITVQRQRTHNQSRKLFRLYCYLTNFWNVLALLMYIVIVSAILVRIFNVGQRMEIRIYSLGLFIIYMRFFHSLMVLKYFGLKLIMIGKMLKELLQFSWILFVFIVCAGVMYHSNMYPNHRDMWPKFGADLENWRIWKIVSLPYWQLYGELSLDQLRGENNGNGTSCTSVESEWESNTNMERCVEYDWAIMVIAAMYLLISNLLLINLIIALFSYRFEEVQNNSDRLWKYWRYAIIKDYSTRFPVPINVLLHVVNGIVIVCKRQRQNGKTGNIREQKSVSRKCIDACSLEPETLVQLQAKYATSRLYSEMTTNSMH